MTFTLKYRKLSSQGSFMAWGVGFTYKYSPENRLLDVTDTRRGRALLRIRFDRHTSKRPLFYIESLEKATQLNALILSNNQTADLSEALFQSRLRAFVEGSARLARYSYDLGTGSFKRFSTDFCKDFELNQIHIQRPPSDTSLNNLYTARLKTNSGKEATAAASSIHGLLNDLAERTIRDLMTSEYGNYHSSSAQNLLSASSNMEKIARILDGGFSPHRQIVKYGAPLDQDDKQKGVF